MPENHQIMANNKQLHNNSFPFPTFASGGDIAQLARAPQSHCGGQGFDSPYLHKAYHLIPKHLL